MRTLQLTYNKDKKNTYDIFDNDEKKSLLYTVHFSSKKPHITITGFDNANAEQFPVGSVIFHTLHNNIEIDVPTGKLNVAVTDKRSGSMKVDGSELSGDLLRDGASANFKFVAAEKAIAHFQAGGLSSIEVGKLQINDKIDSHQLDLLVVSFVVCIEKQRATSDNNAAVVGGRPGINSLWAGMGI